MQNEQRPLIKDHDEARKHVALSCFNVAYHIPTGFIGLVGSSLILTDETNGFFTHGRYELYAVSSTNDITDETEFVCARSDEVRFLASHSRMLSDKSMIGKRMPELFAEG
jgi:hypothetical protein